MCGIYGAIHPEGWTDGAADSLERLSTLLKHRGPDDSGEFIDGNLGLGMHRLSIVGVTNGSQPIWNSSKSVAIVANGEIYNYLELKEKLEELGYLFSTSSDIECLLHLYLEFGMDFLDEVRGMFAFAIYDKGRHELIIGRDRLGEKPLYYTHLGGSFWFSSELPALLGSEISSFRISKTSMSLYLKYGFVPTPTTIIEDIQQLQPATVMTINLDTLAQSSLVYWNPYDCPPPEDEDFAGAYKRELEDIGSKIFQGEASIGIALSGGIDSSLIAILAKKFGKNVTCISIGYESNLDFDESKLASKFSEQIGLPCVIRNISPKETGSRFQECIAALGEPIADPASFSYFILGEVANELGIKVLLSGHGPDEIFYGYPWVREAIISIERRGRTLSRGGSLMEYISTPKFPKGGSLGEFIDRAKTGFGVVENLIQYFEDSWDANHNINTLKFYARKPRARQRARVAKSLGLDFRTVNDEIENLGAESLVFSASSATQILMKTYLQVNGLSQIDRLWMKSGVEGRTLFVDFKLIELAVSDPQNVHKEAMVNKSRFLEYIESFVDETLIRRKKRGFTPPVTAWYKEIYRENSFVLSNSKLVTDGVLPKNAQRLLNSPLTLIGRPRLLWLELAVLEIWYRNSFR